MKRATLRTMNARFVDEATVTVPLHGSMMDANAIVMDPELSAMLRAVIDALRNAIISGEA